MLEDNRPMQQDIQERRYRDKTELQKNSKEITTEAKIP